MDAGFEVGYLGDDGEGGLDAGLFGVETADGGGDAGGGGGGGGEEGVG